MTICPSTTLAVTSVGVDGGGPAALTLDEGNNATINVNKQSKQVSNLILEFTTPT